MSSNENEAPGSDEVKRGRSIESEAAETRLPPDLSVVCQYSSIAGEGPYPLVLARKDAEPPAMETLPLSRAQSRNQA
jgi:hypothetical protein